MPRSQGSGAAEFERRRIQQEREAERERKAAETARKAAEREARQAHVAGRLTAAEQRTADLERRVGVLRTLLVRGLARSASIDLAGLHPGLRQDYRLLRSLL